MRQKCEKRIKNNFYEFDKTVLDSVKFYNDIGHYHTSYKLQSAVE